MRVSVLQPQANPNRLIERVLAQPTWAAEYRRHLLNIIVGACRPGRSLADVARVIEVTREAVFDESSAAGARFERIALGRTDVTLPRLGSVRDPNPGMGPAGMEDIALADWIQRRGEHVRAELAGSRIAARPRP